jgi:hypothetical protein
MYLHMCYGKVKVKVDAWLSRNSFICLASKSWSNVKNDDVIDFVLVSADISLFLE